MFSLAAVLALSVVPSQSAPAQAQPVSVAELPLDALITELPRVGAGCRWNPTADRLECKPAVDEFSRRLAAGVTLSDEQWGTVLTKTGVFRARPKWPASRPFAVSMEMPEWLPVTEIKASPRARGLKDASAESMPPGGCGTYNSWIYSDALYQELGKLSPGAHNITFDVTIDVHQFRSWWGGDNDQGQKLPVGQLWRGPLPIRVEVVPTVDDAVPPVAGTEVDAAVRASVGVAYANWWFDGVQRRTAILVIDPDVQRHPLLSGLALSLEVSLVQRGVVTESKHLIANNADPVAVSNSLAEGDERSIAFCATRIPGSTEKKAGEREGWVIRLAGTSESVEALWDASKRWSGTVEISLDEAVQQDAARGGGKRRGPWVWMPGRR